MIHPFIEGLNLMLSEGCDKHCYLQSLHTSKWFKLVVERTVNSSSDEKLTSTHSQETRCQQPFLQVGRARGREWKGSLARGKMEKMTTSM